MTHEDAGHYGDKHPGQPAPPAEVADAVRARAEGAAISCAAAHGVARQLGREPAEIGRVVDQLELCIVTCQLGLFGYAPQKKIAVAADSVTPEVAADLRAALVDGRLPCRAAWDIAARYGMSRRAIADACETLQIKVRPCQLGAF